jgi:hypothetical protein
MWYWCDAGSGVETVKVKIAGDASAAADAVTRTKNQDAAISRRVERVIGMLLKSLRE